QEYLADIIGAGARILESGCGPCIGQGQSPANDTVTLRTFNRNFPGRTGTKGDQAYLVSPEVAAAAALTGKITEPADLGISYPQVADAEKFLIDDSMLITPPCCGKAVEIIRKKTIGSPPVNTPLPDTIDGEVVIRTGDKTSTDDIMPAGVHLKHRSNIPEYAKVVFERFNEDGKPTFAQRASAIRDENRHGIIVGRDSYGQGSSREHAAICPMYLGVKAVIAYAIERIHSANLINFGIIPFTFVNKEDYESLPEGTRITVKGLREKLEKRQFPIMAEAAGREIALTANLSDEDIRILLAGGRLNLK
ncbi:MAG: aconitate hydratase, partial [Lentisphaeria bacterium]|nr:aconitate hydratase [Lentisphaeria bacterium]